MFTGTPDSENLVLSNYEFGMLTETQTPNTWSYPITSVAYLQETIFVDTPLYPIGILRSSELDQEDINCSSDLYE